MVTANRNYRNQFVDEITPDIIEYFIEDTFGSREKLGPVYQDAFKAAEEYVKGVPGTHIDVDGIKPYFMCFVDGFVKARS